MQTINHYSVKKVIIFLIMVLLAFGVFKMVWAAEPKNSNTKAITLTETNTPDWQQNSWALLGNEQAIASIVEGFSWWQREVDFAQYILRQMLLGGDKKLVIGRSITLGDGGYIWIHLTDTNTLALFGIGSPDLQYQAYQVRDAEFNDVPVVLDAKDHEALASLRFGFSSKENLNNWHTAMLGHGVAVAPLAQLQAELSQILSENEKGSLLIGHCEEQCRRFHWGSKTIR